AGQFSATPSPVDVIGTSGDPVCPLQRPDLRSVPVSTRDRRCAGPRENPGLRAALPPRTRHPRDQYFRHTSDVCGHRVLLAPRVPPATFGGRPIPSPGDLLPAGPSPHGAHRELLLVGRLPKLERS